MFNKSISVVLASFCFASAGQAATYNFGLTYDGTVLSVDAGSDTISGTIINVGDDFTLTVRAIAGEFWTTTRDVVEGFVLAAFNVNEAASRTANIDTRVSYLGTSVLDASQSGVVQRLIHMGSEGTSIEQGAIFDTFSIVYALTGIDPQIYDGFDGYVSDPDGVTTSTIAFDGLIFGGFVEPQFESLGYTGAFVFSSDPSPVPLPAAGGLLIAALGGLAAMRRRKFR